MTVKKSTKNPVMYIFCAYETLEKGGMWLSSSVQTTKKLALEHFEDCYSDCHLHGFFIEVTLPVTPEPRKKCEDYPTSGVS